MIDEPDAFSGKVCPHCYSTKTTINHFSGMHRCKECGYGYNPNRYKHLTKRCFNLDCEICAKRHKYDR